jgi:hypothetical protein
LPGPRLLQARQRVLDGREQIRWLRQREADITRELDGLGRMRTLTLGPPPRATGARRTGRHQAVVSTAGQL